MTRGSPFNFIASGAGVSSSSSRATAGEPRLVSVGGTTVHVREDGPRDAAPVVLLHGFLGSMHWFDRLTPLLAEDFRVIRTDLLGHGRSSKPKRGYAPEDQAAVVDAVLGQLGGAGGTVLGHSLSGDIAIALAERGAKVEKLIIVDEGPDYTVANPHAVNSVLRLPVVGRLIYQNLPASAFRAALKPFFAPGYRLPDAFDTPERRVDDARAVPYECFLSSQVENERFVAQKPLDDRLRALGLATLVVFGVTDQIFRTAESCDRYNTVPNVRVEVIPDAGHSPPLEAPLRTAEVIRAFLGGDPPA